MAYDAIQFQADWKRITEQKQKLIAQNNKQENSKCLCHTYTVGDKVLIKHNQNKKFGTNPNKGPHIVTKI